MENIFNLEEFYNGNRVEQVDLLKEELKRTGYCLVDVSRVRHLTKEVPQALSEFLSTEAKEEYSTGEPVGYMKENWKEGLKLLSGTYLKSGEFDPIISESIRSVLEFYDDFFRKLLFKHSETLFGFEWETIRRESESSFGNVTKEGFGMFDYVNYTNTDMKRTEAVVEHADPGLLSFSLYSDKEGLELFDMTMNTFIKVPLEMGVIWVGEAGKTVSQGQLELGVHRVTKEFGDRRQTFWFEVCVASQLSAKMLKLANKKTDKKAKKMTKNPSTKASSRKTSSEIIKVVGSKGSYRYPITDSTSLGRVKYLYEQSTGIMMSKSGVMRKPVLKKGFENDMPAKDFVVNGVIRIGSETTSKSSKTKLLSNKKGKR